MLTWWIAWQPFCQMVGASWLCSPSPGSISLTGPCPCSSRPLLSAGLAGQKAVVSRSGGACGVFMGTACPAEILPGSVTIKINHQ